MNIINEIRLKLPFPHHFMSFPKPHKKGTIGKEYEGNYL
jgi:hypothetical protein